MRPEDADHAACVDAWLATLVSNPSSSELIELFDRALRNLWERSARTLGVVTLRAIVERILITTAGAHPILSELWVDADGPHVDPLYRSEAVSTPELRAAVRATLIAQLTVTGELTGAILSPALHAALSAVGPANRVDASAPPDAQARLQPAHARRKAGGR
jgi:hypothetical protein